MNATFLQFNTIFVSSSINIRARVQIFITCPFLYTLDFCMSFPELCPFCKSGDDGGGKDGREATHHGDHRRH